MTSPTGRILDFNAALTERELTAYLASDEYDPDRKTKVLSGLNENVESFIAWLFPAAIITPRNARVGNIYGSPGTSLVIETRGDKRGVWKDFADPDQKGGNLIDLFMAARQIPFKPALDELAEWVGHGTKPEVRYQREQAVRKLKHFDRDLGPQKGEWHYTDADGAIIASVYRFEPDSGGKEFLPWDALKRRYGNPDVRPLYNLPAVLKSAQIVVCEGEKAADALIRQGITATAVMGGSNSPLDRTDLEPLRGKEIIIWPDNDEPGRKFANGFALAVNDLASSVRIIEPPADKPQGWDAADAGQDDVAEVLGISRVFDALEMADTPFRPSRFDPSSLLSIPPRRWLVGHRLQRGKVTGGIAPGGVGKSAFSLTTAVAIVTGDSRLTGETIHEAGPVLLIYNEEDEDEVHRRIAAICAFWNIDPEALRDLHMMCSVSGEVKLVTLDKNGSAVVMPEVGLVTEYCRRHGIVYLCCDPFITFHTMPENDNTNVDIAARQFSRIAHDANVAIDLIHHISKGGDSESHAGDISRARGGAAIGAAIRNSYTLAAMSKETAEGFSLGDEYVRFVRLDDGKRNYALRGGEPDWFYLESIDIANGDNVGVIRPFDFEEIRRAAQEQRLEAQNLEREEMISQIEALMAVPEMPLKQLASMIASVHDKSLNWARTAIQSVIPPHPAKVEMHHCTLSIERRGSAQTAPLYVVKDPKTEDC